MSAEEEAGQFMINILKEAQALNIPPESASEYAWAPLKGQDLVKPNKDIGSSLRYTPLKRNTLPLETELGIVKVADGDSIVSNPRMLYSG